VQFSFAGRRLLVLACLLASGEMFVRVLLALAALLVEVLGGWLDVAWALHFHLGFASFPLEALKGAQAGPLCALLTVSTFCISLAVGAELSQAQGLANFLVLFGAGSLSTALAAIPSIENFVFAPVMLQASLAFCVTFLAAGVGDSEKQKRGEKRSSSYMGLFGGVVLFAVIFKFGEPEASCFAQLPSKVRPLSIELRKGRYGFGGSETDPGPWFILDVDPLHNIIQVSTTDEEHRVLFSSTPGHAFIAGALSGSFDAPNAEEMGLYEFQDFAFVFSESQTLDRVVENAKTSSIRLEGNLLFENGKKDLHYGMVFNANSRKHVSFQVNTQKDTKLSRVYLIQYSEEEESIHGMGIQYTFMNLKGGCVPVFTQEQGIGRGLQPISSVVNLFVKHASGSYQTSYSPAAYFLTSAKQGFYLSSKDFALFDFSDVNKVSIEINATSVTGGFIVGDSHLDVIKTYTEKHAGRMRKLPDWVGDGAIMGLQGGTKIVKKHVKTLQDAEVPIAALWLQDWTGKRETDFGRRLQWNWEVSERHYPGWTELIRELASAGIYVMTYINPYLANTGGKSNESTTVFQAANATDCLIKDTGGEVVQIQASATPEFTFGTVDLSNARCQTWYIEEVIQKRMLCGSTGPDNMNGAIGFMADFSESISLGASMNNGVVQGYEWHNKFPEKWAETCHKAMQVNEFYRENGVFFTRAGGSQTPRFSTLMWMGDQMTTWDAYDGMKSALIGILQGGLSGFSLTHSDIGGYTMFQRFGGLVKIVRTPELFLRWAEMNVFSDAVFRTHEGVLPDHSSQAVDKDVIKHFAKMSRLHVKLYELVKKQLIHKAAETGAPLARPLFVHYPDDLVARQITDQFLLGDSLLVCPVFLPNKVSRPCYVPRGDWKPVFKQEEAVIPGASFECQAPIGRPCVLYLLDAENVAIAIRDILSKRN